MGRRLILDTNVLIAYELGAIDRVALDDDELAVAAMTIAEYQVGIELADRAADRARALAAITSVVCFPAVSSDGQPSSRPTQPAGTRPVLNRSATMAICSSGSRCMGCMRSRPRAAMRFGRMIATLWR